MTTGASNRAAFAERLRAYRRRNGLTAEQAAARFGCTAGTWGKWEQGRHEPKGRNRRDLERLLERDERAA